MNAYDRFLEKCYSEREIGGGGKEASTIQRNSRMIRTKGIPMTHFEEEYSNLINDLESRGL